MYYDTSSLKHTSSNGRIPIKGKGTLSAITGGPYPTLLLLAAGKQFEFLDRDAATILIYFIAEAVHPNFYYSGRDVIVCSQQFWHHKSIASGTDEYCMYKSGNEILVRHNELRGTFVCFPLEEAILRFLEASKYAAIFFTMF